MFSGFTVVFLSLATSTIAGLLALIVLLFREPWPAAILACVCILCSLVPAAVLELSLSGSFGAIAIPSLIGFFALGGCFLFPEFRDQERHQLTLAWLMALVTLAAVASACINWILTE